MQNLPTDGMMQIQAYYILKTKANVFTVQTKILLHSGTHLEPGMTSVTTHRGWSFSGIEVEWNAPFPLFWINECRGYSPDNDFPPHFAVPRSLRSRSAIIPVSFPVRYHSTPFHAIPYGFTEFHHSTGNAIPVNSG